MKRMLSKEEFISYINEYREEADTISELYRNYGIDFIELQWYKSSNNFEKLLSFIMDDKEDKIFGTNISWWCWETDFGRNEEMTQIFNEDGSVYKDIQTAEDLYDYLVELSEERDN